MAEHSHDSHHDNGHVEAHGTATASHGHAEPNTPKSFEVRVLRQDAPDKPSYWERHRVEYESDMNVISVLQRIAAQASNVDGKKVAPVAWEKSVVLAPWW